jgi:hypothetical protein
MLKAMRAAEASSPTRQGRKGLDIIISALKAKRI